MTQRTQQILSGLLGLCVGDALGVPVEFTSRAERTKDPVDRMWSYGTWNQPAGTWSDDSSLAFCLADALCDGFSLDAIAMQFCNWYTHAIWTPYGEVFDIGNTTAAAIQQLLKGTPPLEAGGRGESSNGNGSLMRILPMAFFDDRWNFTELLDRVHQVSCVTHAHPRSQMACGIYISIAVQLLQGKDLQIAYQQGIAQVESVYNQSPFAGERSQFQRVMDGTIGTAAIDTIRSGGYVVDTLEAALWCLLNGSTYAETVLQAVNLGGDTDTTAAVTGGLAGLYYGSAAIPSEWIDQLARKADILDLATRLAGAIETAPVQSP